MYLNLSMNIGIMLLIPQSLMIVIIIIWGNFGFYTTTSRGTHYLMYPNCSFCTNQQQTMNLCLHCVFYETPKIPEIRQIIILRLQVIVLLQKLVNNYLVHTGICKVCSLHSPLNNSSHKKSLSFLSTLNNIIFSNKNLFKYWYTNHTQMLTYSSFYMTMINTQIPLHHWSSEQTFCHWGSSILLSWKPSMLLYKLFSQLECQTSLNDE